MTGEDKPYKTLVYDFGTSFIKVGFAGDILPSLSVPSFFAVYNDEIKFGERWYNKVPIGDERIEIYNILDSNYSFLNIGFDILPGFFDYVNKELNVDPKDYAVLVSQPSLPNSFKENLIRYRREITRALFSLNHPAVSFEFDAVLSTFSRGVPTGIVVDLGYSSFRFIPVYNGKPLTNAIKMNTRISGKSISDFIIQNNPECNARAGKFYHMASSTQILYVKMQFAFEVLKEKLNVRNLAGEIENWNLPGSLKESLDLCKQDIKLNLLSNIICSGGLSTQLIADHLSIKLKDFAQVNMRAPLHKNIGSVFSTWFGGSVVGSLDEFMSFCIMKQDWEEHGESIIDSKLDLE